MSIASNSDIHEYRIVPEIDSSKPSFLEAGLRLIEASNLLTEIDRLHNQAASEWAEHPYIRALKSDPEQVLIDLRDFPQEESPIISEIRHRSSEFLLHVRSSLDYCAYNIVWMDRGTPKNHSKFPLVTEKQKWNDDRRSGLPGVNAKHIAWIHDVQPFRGVQWANDLVFLSNHDKHRRMVGVVAVYGFSVDTRKQYADPLGDPTYIGYQIDEPSLKLSIDLPNREPALSDDVPALDGVLREILKGAVAIVNLFLEEYGPSPLDLKETA